MVSTLAHPVDNENPPAIDDLRIDPEFESLHRALTEDEYAALEANILEDDCITDPILVWKSVVVDGHNRLKIWRSLPADTAIQPPVVRELAFNDREQVVEWIILHQLGRRNLTPAEASYLRGKLYESEKDSHGGNRKGDAKSSAQNAHLKSTAVTVAEKSGVNQATLRRDEKYAKAIDRISQVNGKASADLRSGSLKVSKQNVITVSKLAENDDIAQAIKNWRNGRPWDDDGEQDTPPDAAIVRDAIDRTVPTHLAEKHGTAAAIQSVGSRLDSIKRDALALCDEPGGVFIDHDEVEQTFKRLKSLLTQARYWSECPRCRGKVSEECDRCGGHGFLPFSHKGQLSDADKEWLDVA